ncbi:hypothetical protein C5167_015427 [Papaver somniferum]|uniref:Uncharacterized protein n=1 Tax=Papaver somniferum TaxID=3469 RepID=A0A4Y7J953_PAPSO|nr:hypothetical protein C5167_015427 [Papaver somniferum]
MLCAMGSGELYGRRWKFVSDGIKLNMHPCKHVHKLLQPGACISVSLPQSSCFPSSSITYG